MNRVLLSILLTGLLSALTFGSLVLVFALHSAATGRIARDLANKGDRIFVTLDRTQKKTSPGGTLAYYYSYSGRHDGQKFEKNEKVDAHLFHMHSEGKNLEALVYRDAAGTTHLRLRDNQEPYGKRFDAIARVCFAVALGAGAAAMLAALALFASPGFRRAMRAPPPGTPKS